MRGLVLVCALGAAVAAQELGGGLGGRWPLAFVPNRGQEPGVVRFTVRRRGRGFYFTPEGVTVLLGRGASRWAVRLEFVDAEPGVRVEGEAPQETVYSFFRGEPCEWKTGIRAFGAVRYRGVWPGVEVRFTGRRGILKATYRVAPGADPGRIRLRYRGARSVRVTPRGTLRVETPYGLLEQAEPVAHEETPEGPREVAVAYALSREGSSWTYGFRLSGRDPSRTLVVDPAFLVYCGYIGGEDSDWIGNLGSGAIAVDAQGALYVCGQTGSSEDTFPVKVGPDLTYNDGWRQLGDAFVAKVKPDGSGLVYCGYLGSKEYENASAVAVDAQGAAYVTGAAWKNFPTKGGLPKPPFGGAFVTKINPSGTDLVFSGFIGGNRGGAEGYAIAVDRWNNVYVVGRTLESERDGFPVRVGPDLTYAGGDNGDGFIAKVNAKGNALVYCGYIGGESDDYPKGIMVDAQGAAYVGGWTTSKKTFPLKVGPQLSFNGPLSVDGFLCKVDPSGKNFVYSGYIGGAGDDGVYDVAIDASGAAYVSGITRSDERSFPVKVGPDLTYNDPGFGDAFVAKIRPDGRGFLYAGYIGGGWQEAGEGIAVDAEGAAYVVGRAGGLGFPVKLGPSLVHKGMGDAFIAKVRPDGKGLVYSGYIGGAATEEATGVALDRSGNAYVAGWTQSAHDTFPVKVGPDLTFNNVTNYQWYDAFVAKVALVLLEGPQAARIGTTLRLTLRASHAAGKRYQLAASFGFGPIWLDGWRVGLSLDALFSLSVSGLLPQVFAGYTGVFGPDGKATARLAVPAVSALVGHSLYHAFVVLDPTGPGGFNAASETHHLVVTP